MFECEGKQRGAEWEGLIEELCDGFCGREDGMMALIGFDARDKAPIKVGKMRCSFESERREGAFGGGAIETLADFVECVEVLVGAVGASVGAFALEHARKQHGSGLQHTFFAG